jgi:hypothetical protein
VAAEVLRRLLRRVRRVRFWRMGFWSGGFGMSAECPFDCRVELMVRRGFYLGEGQEDRA